jgi:hypothetical protein
LATEYQRKAGHTAAAAAANLSKAVMHLSIMKWILLSTCLLLTACLQAQIALVRELKSRPSTKYYNTTDSTIIYPIIVTASPVVSRLINKQIKIAVLEVDPDEKSRSTSKPLQNSIRNGLTDMSYDVTYNKNGILSLHISQVIEAAYPNQSDIYLNFDLRSGQSIQIGDIINDSLFRQFRSKVFADKIDSLKAYENKNQMLFTKKEIDTTTYEWAAQEVDSFCLNTIDISNFSLSKTGIKIIDECEFPHVIRSLSPEYELLYSYQFMYPYLRSEFRDRLLFKRNDLN